MNTLRVVASLLFGFGVTLLVWTIRFVTSQSTSILREATQFHAGMWKVYGPLALVVAAAWFLVARRRRRSGITVAAVVFVLGLAAWGLIRLPAFQDLLLPPVSGK